MSTIGYENWAVDMADVGAIYPFQGWEVPMVIVGVAFWLGWHVLQMRAESEELEAAKNASVDAADVSANLDRY